MTDIQVVVTEAQPIQVTVEDAQPINVQLADALNIYSGIDGEADKEFMQQFTNQSEVLVNHNLQKVPAVTVIDSADEEVTGRVVHHNINSLTVYFSGSFSGKIYLN